MPPAAETKRSNSMDEANVVRGEPRAPIPSWGTRAIRLFLRVGLTALLVALIVREVDFAELVDLLANAQLGLVAVAVLLTVALNLVKPMRWLILVRAAVAETRYSTALKSILVAVAGRIVLPSKIGEFARIFMIPGLRVSSGVGLTLIDILVEAQVALLWAIPGIFVLGGQGAVIGAAVGLVLIGLVTRYPHRCAHPIARFIRSEKLDAKLLSARAMMQSLGTGGWLQAIGITVVISIFRFSQLFVLLQAVGADVSWGSLAYLPLIQLSDAVPLTIGGVGVREWVGLQILPQAGIAPGAAVGAVLLQSLITNMLPGAVGLIFARRAQNGLISRLRRGASLEEHDREAA